MSRTIIIRNMVCDRCRTAVQRILKAHDLSWVRLELGEVEMEKVPSSAEMQQLRAELLVEGFDIVVGRDAQVIARTKAALVKAVHHGGGERVELAKLVQRATNKELSGVSKLFNEVEGITLEHYFLLQRLERVKELIRYGELSFSEIAFAVGFSSPAHFSAQFKRLTGMTPTAFRKAHGPRSPLDRVG